MSDFDRTLPHDIEAEQAVLGALLISPQAYQTTVALLRPADFYRGAHELVFRAAMALNQRAEPVDVHTVKAELERVGELRKFPTGALYLHDLTSSVPSPAHATSYAQRVRQLGLRRRLIEAGVRIEQMGYSEGDEVEDSIEQASAEIRHIELFADDRITDLSTLAEFVDETDAEHEWLIPGVLEVMDRVIVVASEGAGKTTLARQAAVLMAAGRNPFSPRVLIPPVRTLYVDLENPPALIRRKARHLIDQARRIDGWDDSRCWRWTRPGGINLRRPADQALLDRVIHQSRPQLVAMGPLYKAFTDGGERAEQLNSQVAQVLDRMREKHRIALWLETHAPMEQNGQRSLRPMGSGVWSRWPEFGLALRKVKEEPGSVWVERFRGDRDERAWPDKLTRSAPWPWEGKYAQGIPVEQASGW